MDSAVCESSSRRLTPQRRRTAYACVICRARKTRCDGQNPCSACAVTAADCSYDHDISSTKGKSDLILSAIRRLEDAVGQVDATSTKSDNELILRSISRLEDAMTQIDAKVSALQLDVLSATTNSASHHFSLASVSENSIAPANTHTRSTLTQEQGDLHEFSNATISADHTSTTEAIFHWPVFQKFPELQHEEVLKSGAVFWMENSRERQIERTTTIPFLSEDELDTLIAAFQRTVNFSYPIIPQSALDRIRDRYSPHDMDSSTTTCFMLLVMALGCAAETLSASQSHPQADTRKVNRMQALGRIYFDAAVSRLHAAYCTITVESAQCLALTVLYYAYLQRPLQAWSMLSSTATACRVMTAYSTNNPEDSECTRRIFWMCFILESDYLAELPALPQFGIGEMESNVPLPGQFITNDDPEQVELSSLYFLACISMRRLLNRCHHVLFGQETLRKQSITKLSNIVLELSQQLEDWRRHLPPQFSFSVDTEVAESQHAGFLRQRYLTCKALIHRPYIMSVISDHTAGRTSDDRNIEGARKCLQASLLHILNLRPFNQTVMVDVWICSLSMAGTMMILLVAVDTSTLAVSLAEEIHMVGAHLVALLSFCISIHGEGHSPSVQQAIDWIKVIDSIIRKTTTTHASIEDRDMNEP